MNLRLFLRVLLIAALLPAPLFVSRANAAVENQDPDSLLLKDGSTLRGLIIKNSPRDVTIQTADGEKTISKSEIVRIRDEADTRAVFTGARRKGELPPWRAIANDLRSHDNIREVVQIPAARIDNGRFARIPYLSFRVNRTMELNIFGNPDSPVALEFGLFGGRKFEKSARAILRSYLAGFLATGEEVSALYSIDLKGGTAPANGLQFEIIPPDAPDAFGTWWLVVYRPALLDEARLPDADYARRTVPADLVRDRSGRHPEKSLGGRIFTEAKRIGEIDDFLLSNAMLLQETGVAATDSVMGFFRDKDGNFRLIPFELPDLADLLPIGEGAQKPAGNPTPVPAR